MTADILLVDGDDYEPKNYERQEFTRLGNKADIKALVNKVTRLTKKVSYR